jgi:hypothetical protein
VDDLRGTDTSSEDEEEGQFIEEKDIPEDDDEDYHEVDPVLEDKYCDKSVVSLVLTV